MTPPQQPKEHIERLKEHLQQLKNDGFKVIADCESLSISGIEPEKDENDFCMRGRMRVEQAARQSREEERKKTFGLFDQTKGIDNCETCQFRPKCCCDCNLVDVAILSGEDWEKYCPLKKIESLRQEPPAPANNRQKEQPR